MKRVDLRRVLTAGLLALGFLLGAGCPDQEIARRPGATVVVANHLEVEQHVYIDNNWRGAVPPGGVQRFAVSAGRHVVVAADSVDPNDNPETEIVLVRPGEDRACHVSGDQGEKTIGRYAGLGAQYQSETALLVINHAEKERHVYLDETWMGSIRRRGFRVFRVSPGPHTVMVSHSRNPDDQLMSREINVVPGQTGELQIYQQGMEELFRYGRPDIFGESSIGVPVRIINESGDSQHIYSEGEKLGVVGVGEDLTVFVHVTRPVVTVTYYARGKGHPVSREFDLTVEGPYLWRITGEE